MQYKSYSVRWSWHMLFFLFRSLQFAQFGAGLDKFISVNSSALCFRSMNYPLLILNNIVIHYVAVMVRNKQHPNRSIIPS